jgi:hypothetical protein
VASDRRPAHVSPVPYLVSSAFDDCSSVHGWSGYPLQFEGQRRFSWQDDLAAELKTALSSLIVRPGECLAGTYMTNDPAKCDVENRLFTNPGASSFPKGIMSTRFERGFGELPDPPATIAPFAGHIHHYRYRAGGDFEWWEPDRPIARWERVLRPLPGDGSCRPTWLALRQAAADGSIEIHGTPVDDQTLGVR